MAEQARFCLRCASELAPAEHFGRARLTCPACGWIHFEDPKVAAAVLLERGNQVLLVRRANEPFRGYWTLPAGFIDAGEDPREAARRECQEETGLVVEVTRVLDVVAGREHARGADFVIVFQAEALAGSIVPGDDADAVEWFARTGLPPLAFHATRQILRARI